MTLFLSVVDAFTTRPFAGNPAGVCVLDEARDDAWLAALAAEVNLSETAFLTPVADDPARFGLRWFTPAVEVDLCGHATLAAAHTLWETGRVAAGEPIAFDCASGRLGARHLGGEIALDFPAEPVAGDADAAATARLADALGVEPLFAGRNRLDHLVEVALPADVAGCRPDLDALLALGSRGVMVTAAGTMPASSGDHDFVSRYFAPAAGIAEDPVTGSAHCALGPYWAERLGADEVVGAQISARGGVVRVRVRGADVAPGRLVLAGPAKTVMSATLHV